MHCNLRLYTQKIPARPDVNIRAEPRTIPNVVVDESKARTISDTDPTLMAVNLVFVNKITEARDADSKLKVTATQSKNAPLFECPIVMKAAAMPRGPISKLMRVHARSLKK